MSPYKQGGRRWQRISPPILTQSYTRWGSFLKSHILYFFSSMLFMQYWCKNCPTTTTTFDGIFVFFYKYHVWQTQSLCQRDPLILNWKQRKTRFLYSLSVQLSADLDIYEWICVKRISVNKVRP